MPRGQRFTWVSGAQWKGRGARVRVCVGGRVFVADGPTLPAALGAVLMLVQGVPRETR